MKGDRLRTSSRVITEDVHHTKGGVLSYFRSLVSFIFEGLRKSKINIRVSFRLL